MDKAITLFLHVFSVGMEAIGYALLWLTGYGWLWGASIPYKEIFRNPAAVMRMEGFYAGLAAFPILAALLVSLLFGDWYVLLLVGGGIGFALLLNTFFKKNIFLPICCGFFMTLLVVAACLLRISIVLLLFFCYVALVLLGPVLLALFLAAL